MKRFFFLLLIALSFAACNTREGYEESNGVYWKLVRFGDGATWGESDYSRIAIQCQNPANPDSILEYQLYSGLLKADQDSGAVLSDTIVQLLANMKQGEEIEILSPYGLFDGTMLDGYNGGFALKDTELKLNIRLEQTFEREAFTEFIMNASQIGEMTETEAIGLFFVNHKDDQVEQRGDVFIERLSKGNGKAIKVGDEVTMQLHTHLLSGLQLDELTTLTFTYGRPGQIVPGLQYALSFLTENDKARVFMPSYLAFGEEGNSNGLVPDHTPVYFSVHVLSVKTPSVVEAK